MPVKVAKLWSQTKFQNLSITSKLFYVYLATNPGISVLGVCTPNLNVASAEMGVDLDTLRDSTRELSNKGYILVKKYEDIVYFVVPAHFNTIPKSDSTVIRVNKALDQLPSGLVEDLNEVGISTDRKVTVFKKPTLAEVRMYCLSQGYAVNAETIVDFYEGKAKAYNKPGKWVDSRGKEVKDWRAKIRVVWFKDKDKLKLVPGAPKGFEYFHIVKGGNLVFPDRWVDGKPKSKDFSTNAEMLKKFNEVNK